MQPHYYSSSRKSAPATPPRPRRSRRRLVVPLVLVAIVVGVLGVMHSKGKGVEASQTSNQQTSVKPVAQTKADTTTQANAAGNQTATTNTATTNTACKVNSNGQLVLVSISQRHLWACNGTSQLYDSAVVTGMENLPADLTPVGTYHIYGKYVNTYLKGSDSTGSWNDYVNYWMPWLHNQYGSYGFHDATWRDPSAFGNISPYSTDASHGCVELPLATAKWLYNWTAIGTTVTIES